MSDKRNKYTRRHIISASSIGLGLVTTGCLDFVSPNQNNQPKNTPTSSNTPSESVKPKPPERNPIDGQWPMYQFDQMNRGAGDGDIPQTDVIEKWRYNTDKQLKTQAGPAINDDRVFIGTYGGELHAIDGTSGQSLWVTELASDSYVTPAVDGDTVYVSSVKRLYALDLENGEVLWRFRNQGNVPPTIKEGVIYMMKDYGGVGNQTTTGMVAIDADNGERKWRTGFTGDVFPFGSVAVGDNALFASTGRYGNTLYSLNVGNGDQRWSFKPSKGGIGYPVIGDDKLYAVNEIENSNNSKQVFNILALDKKSGDKIWSNEIAGESLNSPALSIKDSELFVPSSKIDSEGKITLLAINTASGSEKWSASVGTGGSTSSVQAGAPVVTSRHIYLGNHQINRQEKSYSGSIGPRQSLKQSAVAGNTLVYPVGQNLVAVTTQR
jgi:outer membrane protein assembly factor BamB